MSHPFSFTITTFINTETIVAFSNQVIQRGATGDDVVELRRAFNTMDTITEKLTGFMDGERTGQFEIFRINSG